MAQDSEIAGFYTDRSVLAFHDNSDFLQTELCELPPTGVRTK
jgi:hypothetical protein